MTANIRVNKGRPFCNACFETVVQVDTLERCDFTGTRYIKMKYTIYVVRFSHCSMAKGFTIVFVGYFVFSLSLPKLKPI